MIHFYDPDAQEWRSIKNPTERDIAELLITVSHSRPCASCDADVEYEWLDSGVPDIAITHEPGCPLAA